MLGLFGSKSNSVHVHIARASENGWITLDKNNRPSRLALGDCLDRQRQPYMAALRPTAEFVAALSPGSALTMNTM